MRRAFTATAGVLALVLSAAAGAGAAEHVTPPADTPNLALMVIQPADLVPGATLVSQGYIKPPARFTAYYASAFALAGTADGVRYDAIEDFVALAPDAATAGGLLASQEATFGSRAGQKRLVKVLLKSTPKRDHLKAKDISFSGHQSAGVGTGSFIETINFKIHHLVDHQVVVFFESGPVDASLVLTGTVDERVPDSDGVSLATAIDGHIASTLAASGTTGASGTSGSSGATGAS